MEFTSNSVEGITSEAAAKGMYVVDPSDSDALLEEYEEKLSEAEALLVIQDPESTPYASKYKARETLDAILNKLEATKTVALMEGRRAHVGELSWRIAAAQVKLGTHTHCIALSLLLLLHVVVVQVTALLLSLPLRNTTDLATDAATANPCISPLIPHIPSPIS
jgi:hypothetical protein